MKLTTLLLTLLLIGCGSSTEPTPHIVAPPTPPSLVSIQLQPDSVTTTVGGSRQLSYNTTWSDGLPHPVTVSVTATGGTMSGLVYNAGTSIGSYRVVIRELTTNMADTTTVTIVPAPLPPATGTIVGHITGTNRSFLQNVRVTLTSPIVLTDDSVYISVAAGDFHFTHVPATTVQLRFSELPTGCTTPPVQSVVVIPNDTTVVDITVSCAPVVLGIEKFEIIDQWSTPCMSYMPGDIPGGNRICTQRFNIVVNIPENMNVNIRLSVSNTDYDYLLGGRYNDHIWLNPTAPTIGCTDLDNVCYPWSRGYASSYESTSWAWQTYYLFDGYTYTATLCITEYNSPTQVCKEVILHR